MLCFKEAVGPATVAPCRLCLAVQVDEHNPLATPLRTQNSFLPWKPDGSICEEDMTSNLYLERLGALQQWPLRTMKQLEDKRLTVRACHRAGARSTRGASASTVSISAAPVPRVGPPRGCDRPDARRNGGQSAQALSRHAHALQKEGLDWGRRGRQRGGSQPPWPPGVSIQPIFDTQLVASAAGLNPAIASRMRRNLSDAKRLKKRCDAHIAS